ncbi:DUF7282 domain-containing protein [Halobacterium wangiae]|uniref:DUF7282 domain-containing protein n=1 Tax=Halobacterium wangiae TaxID=2902623 RepID=UPI001E3CBE08|nr:hypothetical protein [Halobacterium wangiae]
MPTAGHIRTLGVVAVAAMVALSGGVAAAAFVAPTTTQSTAPQTDASNALQQADASVTFDDQTATGNTVTIQNVTLPEGGYVAVHATTGGANDTVGDVIGVSDYLEAGSYEDVTVTLYEDVPGADFENTAVNGTETLVAMAHQETSDTDQGGQPTTTPDDNETTTATDTTTTTTDTTTADTTTTETTTTETTTETPNGGTNDTTDDNTTDGNATAMFGAAQQQQQESPTFDFVTSDGQEDGPYLVDGEPVTDSAEVTFAGETTPGEDDGATDDTEAATGGLVVEDLDAPGYAVPGSNVTVDATVTNEGGENREEDVAFRLEDGDVDVVVHQTVAVGAGETTTVTFEVDTTGVPNATYIHGVTTENSSEFDVIDVTNESAVDVEDQNVTGGTFTVDSVFVPEGGYVALHDDSVLDANASAGPETVVGVSDYLEAGYHEDVNVTLYGDVPGADFGNVTLSDTETVVAVPHVETNQTDAGNATSTFDFVTSGGVEDGPDLVDGELVVDAATVTPDETETNTTA